MKAEETRFEEVQNSSPKYSFWQERGRSATVLIPQILLGFLADPKLYFNYPKSSISVLLVIEVLAATIREVQIANYAIDLFN